jgi:hypothetical protein
MRIVIVIALIGILFSLGSALFYLMRDKGTTNRTVNALTVRVGISVALFLFILFSYWMAGSSRAAISAAARRHELTLQPVDDDIKADPDHVDEVPVPGRALEREVLVWTEVPAYQT